MCGGKNGALGTSEHNSTHQETEPTEPASKDPVSADGGGGRAPHSWRSCGVEAVYAQAQSRPVADMDMDMNMKMEVVRG